eukprot:6213726-Pleurochrysis_carterae.AAC.2
MESKIMRPTRAMIIPNASGSSGAWYFSTVLTDELPEAASTSGADTTASAAAAALSCKRLATRSRVKGMLSLPRCCVRLRRYGIRYTVRRFRAAAP